MSHAASAWAFRATAVSVAERAVPCCPADLHGPGNGCHAGLSRLAGRMGVDRDLTVRVLVSPERRGLILRADQSDRRLLRRKVFPE